MSVFGGGSKSSQSSTPTALNALRVQTSVFGRGLTVVFGRNRIAPNLMWGDDFKATPITSTQSAGGKGGGGAQPQTTGYSYTASVILGICEGPIASVNRIWLDKEISTLSALKLTAFLGTTPQSVWSFLTTNHPAEAINYPGIAYVAGAPYQLTDNGDLQNHTFEIQGFRGFNVGAGKYDANAKDILSDVITNTNWGLGLSPSVLGDLTAFSNYIVANGFFCSPIFDEQQEAQQYLDDIITSLNCMPYWASGVLKVQPLGDATITGNGATFTPDMTPLYDLTDDDYLYSSGTDPVRCKRVDPADASNALKWEILDRSNDYNIAVIEAKDQALIDQYGLRSDSTRTAHHICDPVVGNALVQVQLQRTAYVRNEYEVTVGHKFVVLEPSDLITISDEGLGLVRQLVRVLEWTEDGPGEITLQVEEVAVGTASAPLYGRQAGSGYIPNYNVAPGAVNTPIIFDAPPELATTGGLETWCAVSGLDSNWGGADVWLSSDDVTYQRIGRIFGPSRMGVTTATLAAGLDPDTVNSLSVDLSQSLGTILSGTKEDADAYHTACYVGGEVVSYQTATLTAANKYDLTYLRRGAYNTLNAAHAIGSPFCRIDEALFKFAFSKDQIGATIYVKLTSFNGYGGGQEDLASVTAYPHLIEGPTRPLKVQNFVAAQNGNVVTFTWTDLVNFALKGYDIGYAPASPYPTTWNQFTLLTDVHRGTEMTNASVPPGEWVFGIVGHDIADQLSNEIAMQALTVTLNNQQVVAFSPQAPIGWPGTLTNMVQHYTGVLFPENQFTPSHYADYSDVDSFVVDPFASCSYDAPVIDLGFADNYRVYAAETAGPGPGVIGTPNISLQIDYWATGIDPAIFQNWTTGSIFARYLVARANGAPVDAPFVLRTFQPTADQQLKIDGNPQGVPVVVSALGTHVDYSLQFHNPPNVIPTALGVGGLTAQASNITATGFDIFIFSGATSVGGSANWQATGI